MGFSSLRLINPCDFLDDKARWLAFGSGDILENARIFDSLEDALEDIDFSIATTAKRRLVRDDYYHPNTLVDLLLGKGPSLHHVAIVFGREDQGLSNAEIRLCDIVSSVPLYAHYPSLNLAQSVMIYAYELAAINLSVVGQSQQANSQNLRVLKSKIAALLTKIAIAPHNKLHDLLLERTGALSELDIKYLFVVCNKLEKILETNSSGIVDSPVAL